MEFNNYGKQNNKGAYSPTVYSPYRMNNATSKVDQTCLTFSYWNSTMCVGIHPKKNTGSNDVQFDMQGGIKIFLSHPKARMFHHIVKQFRNDPAAYNNCGVASGKGLIVINDGSEFGVSNPCLVIRAIDEQGNINGSFAYEFKREDFYYGIYHYQEDGNKYDKNFEDFKDIELDMLETVLEQYYTSMTMATAFTVLDTNKNEMSKLNGKIESIGNKLGVEFGKNTNGGDRFQNKSFFANSEPGNASTFTPASLADLDD